jgi:hypothetical protein
MLSIAMMKTKPLNAQQARAGALIQSHIPYTLPDLDVTDKSATHRVNNLKSLTFTVSQLNRIYKKKNIFNVPLLIRQLYMPVGLLAWDSLYH